MNPFLTCSQLLLILLQVQYCKKQKGPSKHTTCPYVGGSAMRHRYQCTGVKHCEHLDNELKQFSHTVVSPETWEQMANSRINAYRGQRDPRKQKTTRYSQPVLNPTETSSHFSKSVYSNCEQICFWHSMSSFQSCVRTEISCISERCTPTRSQPVLMLYSS